ncbi:MAG TPA: SPFH domain-containing protein [Phycisphaerales bacterium]|nr:SPFH domain-containing protein [Phycisphaerales bacterium]
MSDPREPIEGLTMPGDAPVPGARAASVRLRTGAGDDRADLGAMMDPAAQSLAEALRVTYRILQLAMVVLLAVFLLSGLESVQLGERAVRVRFGRVVQSDLGPGFQFSLPYPIGELVRVETAAPQQTLAREFWPSLTAEEERLTTEQLAGGGRDSLDPETDGSLVTGDGMIVHARWAVSYRRTDPARVLESLDREHERSIVLGAVRRGIVHAAAVVSANEFLTGQPDPGNQTYRPVADRAKELAQQTLDQMRSGIEIDRLVMTEAMAPRHVAPTFNQVMTAEQNAEKAIEAALDERGTRLTAAAGQAAELVLAQIDEYERRLDLGEVEEAEAAQQRIDRLLLGEAEPGPDGRAAPPVFGEVTAVLSEARKDRDNRVGQARSELALYQALRESYQQNPSVVINREWTDAMSRFLGRDSVQVLQLMPGLEKLVLMINKDPDVSRDQLVRRRRAEMDEIRAQRQRDISQRRFETKVDSRNFQKATE